MENSVESIPHWSFKGTQSHSTPIIGTFHTSDSRIMQAASDQVSPSAKTYRRILISMAYNKYPDEAVQEVKWPRYGNKRYQLTIGASRNKIGYDRYRMQHSQLYKQYVDHLVI